MTPMSPIDKSNAVPPWLMNTSGTPVSGKTPVIEAIFMKDWAVIMVMIPVTSILLKGSGARVAILYPRKAKATNKHISITEPRNPSSSPMTANIESPCASGK